MQNKYKDSIYYIFNIEHELVIRGELVNVAFHLKIAEIDESQILMKSLMNNVKRYTVDLEIDIYSKEIKELIHKFC